MGFKFQTGRRILIEGNLLEYSRKDGQSAFALVLTPRGAHSRAPWTTVESVTIRSNLMRHVGAALTVIGRDDAGDSGPTRAIRIEQNVFADVDVEREKGAGEGSGKEPEQASGLVFRDNIVHNRFGVHGEGRAFGKDSLDAFFPGAVFSSNAIGGGDRIRYPGRQHSCEGRGAYTAIRRLDTRGLSPQTRKPLASDWLRRR